MENLSWRKYNTWPFLKAHQKVGPFYTEHYFEFVFGTTFFSLFKRVCEGGITSFLEKLSSDYCSHWIVHFSSMLQSFQNNKKYFGYLVNFQSN